MALTLVDLHRGEENKHLWVPRFDTDTAYENEHWWSESLQYVAAPWFVQVFDESIEVARVELDDPGGINPDYLDAPELGPERLEVQMIEVATRARGHGVGTSVIRALEQRHSDRRLFAYSEGANTFWASLGWERFDHPEGEQWHRPLFIQPG